MTDLDPTATNMVLAELLGERYAQHDKWGQQDRPDVDEVLMRREGVTDPKGRYWPGGCTPARMAEHYEILTAARAKFLCDVAARNGQLTYAHILIEELAEAIEAATLENGTLRTELIQVAAVAVAWVEKIDRSNERTTA